MNLIVEKSERIKWYTDLFPFFDQISDVVTQHEWLWTDDEVVSELPEHKTDEHQRKWVDGATLIQFVRNRPQFVWSVLSAIDPNDVDNARSDSTYPSADGNGNLWLGTPQPQHPCAKFEIVCWDSTATLLINANEALANAFRNAYPGCIDLDELNARTSAENAG